MLEHYVLGVVGKFRGNPTNFISISLSGLQLFLSQFLKLVDQTDCHKSFLGVFPQYVVIPMSEQCVVRVVGNIRRNPTTPISTNLSVL